MSTRTSLMAMLGTLVCAVALGCASAPGALAGEAWWGLTQSARPSRLPVEGAGKLVLMAQNRGDVASSGEVALVDHLPASVKTSSVTARSVGKQGAKPFVCVRSSGLVTCSYNESLPAFDEIEIVISVNTTGAKSGEVNELSVTGGGAPPATLRRALTVGGTLTGGIEDYSLSLEEEGGRPDTQAGSHPFQVTAALTLNQTAAAQPVELPKDIFSKLPPGLIGNPTPLPKCTAAQFDTLVPEAQEEVNACPESSAVGVATVTLNEPTRVGVATFVVPVFNVEPEVGEPARFGFYVAIGEAPVLLDASLRTGGDYGVTIGSSNITQTIGTLSFQLTFWGVPGAAVHDPQRGWGCLTESAHPGTAELPCTTLGELNPPPFLSLPTSCGGPLESSIEADGWNHPHPAGERQLFASEPMQAMDGCNRLPFAPEIRTTPDGAAASSPTGLNVDVHVPQDSVLSAEGLAESNVRDITVALPEGVAVNPAGGDGLTSCSDEQIGYLPGTSEPPARFAFTPTLTEPFCPTSSKIGTVTIHSPLLPNPLVGAVYLATQNANPFGSLIATYIVAHDPQSGATVKLPGAIRLSPTGQIVATFQNNPQLAFEDAELHFFGGERAPLSTPSHCGTYTTDASFVPWTAEPSDEALVTVSSSAQFAISSGPNGGPCPGASLPFSPSLQAGTTNINAGVFSPLTTTIGREDGNQDMQSVLIHTPPGLEGLLAGVKLCPEAQANEGTCGPESQIGETTVSAGVGSDPVTVTGGKVYITESYAGAPFGLSIVNPVKAGPFDLEHDTANPAQNPPCDCVVVRAKVEVDPSTAALTITTDPTGPHAIPRLIDGIPVQIKRVNVLVNRLGFTFNPTNCSPLAITGAITSYEGVSEPLSVPFQATNCAVLKLAPKFTVSTTGRTSRQTGASLTAKLSYPAAAMGTQANLAKVKVSLPIQLPAQLKTLQKACLSKVFEANPASCPAQSIVGHAKVVTPLLPVPLTGPAYFVSHGGEAFPSLTMVLQGYGVTVKLVGATQIKKGITSTTFKTVPDVPFNTFELTLPQGEFAALGANLPPKSHGSFCGQNLKMPTEFIAQNGLEIKRNTQITVTGCPKAHRAKKRKKRRA